MMVIIKSTYIYFGAIAAMSIKNIVLVGLMGSGKTTIGQELLDHTGFTFIDTDRIVEDMAGMRIVDIFEIKGEAVFRKFESEAVKKAIATHNSIISTGGGAFEDEQNRKELLSKGNVFYLKASADCLHERVKNDNSRPLLWGDNPQQILQELIEKREPQYLEAHHTIDVENLTIMEIVDEILQRVL
ncbi:MAG: shikimate kinase [Alphaproteobacteria bacterium]|nr:shikimate kinase [Alphaproteobacteria bacterium]